jgi:hypothetical protein
MASRKYAERTSVPVDRSKAEIESILKRYGAAEFGYATRGNKAAVMFSANNKHLRFVLPLPDMTEFTRSPRGRTRRSTVATEEHAREIRRRWRALALEIKAKLEAVQTGIAIFEQEFLAQIVLPNGHTVAETILPGIEEAYRTGQVAGLLPDFTEPARMKAMK